MRFSTLGFFHQSSLPRSLIIILKYFQIWFRFRQDIANLWRLCAMRHSAESQLRAMLHRGESHLRAMLHSGESHLRAMPHNAESTPRCAAQCRVDQKFFIEFHIELHSPELSMNFFF
jgi:hypothetical protein